MNRKGQQSAISIGLIWIILLIIIFVGLGTFMGVASDSNRTNGVGGVAGWFFGSWQLIIFLCVIVYFLWSMGR